MWTSPVFQVPQILSSCWNKPLANSYLITFFQGAICSCFLFECCSNTGISIIILFLSLLVDSQTLLLVIKERRLWLCHTRLNQEVTTWPYILIGIEMKKGIQKQKVSHQPLSISRNSMLVGFCHHKTYAVGCFILKLWSWGEGGHGVPASFSI